MEGELPSPRAGHTMTIVGTKVIIFGGGDGNRVLNDVHFLDTADDRYVWYTVFIVYV